MTQIRVENEIKFLSSEGPFQFSGSNAEQAVKFLRNVLKAAGMSSDEPRFINILDTYYTDAEDTFWEKGIILRYRVIDGWKHMVTVKLPYIRDGLGLSRREIETEISLNENQDPTPQIRGHAEMYTGVSEINPVPKVKAEILRIRMIIKSTVRSYNLSFDRISYSDPKSGKHTLPGYELEIESIDAPIKDDVQMLRLINILSETGQFREERISKYSRGRNWVESL